MTLRSSAQQRVPRKQLEIDLSPIAWFSPLGVVALLATYLHVASREVAVTCVLPESRVVRTCLERIGFLAELELLRHALGIGTEKRAALLVSEGPGPVLRMMYLARDRRHIPVGITPLGEAVCSRLNARGRFRCFGSSTWSRSE